MELRGDREVEIGGAAAAARRACGRRSAACAAATMMPPGIANRPARPSASCAVSAGTTCCHIAARTCSGGTSSVRWTSGRWWMRGMRSRLIVIATGPSHSSRNASKNAGHRVAIGVGDDARRRRRRTPASRRAASARGRARARRAAATASGCCASRLLSITSSALVPVRRGELEQQLLAEAALALDREHDLVRAQRRGRALDRDRRERAADRAGAQLGDLGELGIELERAAVEQVDEPRRGADACGTSASRSAPRRARAAGSGAAASSATDRAPSASASAACRRRAARAAGRRARGSRIAREVAVAPARGSDRPRAAARTSASTTGAASARTRGSGRRAASACRASIVARIRASVALVRREPLLEHLLRRRASSPPRRRAARRREQPADVARADDVSSPSRPRPLAPAEPDLVLERAARRGAARRERGSRRPCMALLTPSLTCRLRQSGSPTMTSSPSRSSCARDPAAHDVVDVRAVRRALIDRDEPALVHADPHVLADARESLTSTCATPGWRPTMMPPGVSANRWPMQLAARARQAAELTADRHARALAAARSRRSSRPAPAGCGRGARPYICGRGADMLRLPAACRTGGGRLLACRGG